MNKILARILSAILLLCMIPAAVITAFANGYGVAQDETENQSLVWDNNQYIPETVVVDGKFDDAGWAVEEWQYADSSTGTWDTESPSEINRKVSYKYQLHYDSEYFYVAAVINMPEGVTNGNLAVYLSERRHLVSASANRGASAGFTFTINGSEVSVKAEKGADDNNASYANNRAVLNDSLLKANVENGVVTIEFRNALDSTVDRDYTIYGAHKNLGTNGGNNISYYISMNLPHVNSSGTATKNDIGNDYDMLFHPVWSQGVSAALVPTAENWPGRHVDVSSGRNGLHVPTSNIMNLSQLIEVDGNLDEAQWNGQMFEVNSATGTYTERPFDGNSLSYSFNVIADKDKLYGAVIIDAEARKDLDTATANDGKKADAGTQFEIWFRGVDNRETMEMTKDEQSGDGVASVEYEFYKHYHDSSDYYSTELTYYINHQYTFQLYEGGQYNNDRGGRELYYDVNPEAAPDYYVTKEEDKWVRNEKTFGEDGAYNYAYKVIDGKTYLEFCIDLKSVHCDENEIEIFVSTRHMKHTDSNTRNNLQLYYPKLLINDDGKYAETTNLWLTHYNELTNVNYGINGYNVNGATGIIFDDYNKYKTTMESLGSWFNEMLLVPIAGTTNSYTIQKKKDAGEDTGAGTLGNPGVSGTLWYCFGIGTYYPNGKTTQGITVSSTTGPIDSSNLNAYHVHQTFSKWNIGDEMRLNFNYKTDINAENKTITYHGRLDANATDDIVVTNIGMTTTNHTATQEIALESAKYVKFEFDNTGGGWTFISQVHVFQGQERKQLVKEQGVKYTIYGDSPSYPDSGDELIDNTGYSDSSVTTYSNTDYPNYVGMSNDLAKEEGYNLPTVIVNLGKVYEDITGFNVWMAANSNAGATAGITVPEKVTVYVSLDGENWEYATHIAPTGKAKPGDGKLANTIASMDVRSGGNRANAYYSPYTVTRVYKTNSLTNNTGGDQNTSCFYYWRNRHMPGFDKYGETKNWMYDSTDDMIAAEHIAPEVIAIDDNLGDAGWNQYNWTEVDGAINATGNGPKFDYQIRSDGKYLYVASLVNSTNPTFGLWIKANDGKINYYEIADGTTTLPVQIPEYTGEIRVDEYTNEAAEGTTLAGTDLTYSYSLKAMQWDGSAWNSLTYEDTTFFGYTKEILENTTNGEGAAWTAIPLTKGFRFGIESARIESANGKLIRQDSTGKVLGNLHALVTGTAEQRTVEFKIALSEFGGLNGFEYFIQVKDGETSTIYPQVYNETTGFVVDGTPDLPSYYAFKVTAADVINGGKLWMRNDYAPITSLGAKVHNNYQGQYNAIRFGARFTEDFIRRQSVAESTVTDYWDVADMGIIFAPTSYLTKIGKELKLSTENVAKVTAIDIVNWKNDTADAKTNFADYESFVFYVTYKGFPEAYFDEEFSFCGFVDYYDANGSPTYYSQVLGRSYSGVNANAYSANEDTQMPGNGSN